MKKVLFIIIICVLMFSVALAANDQLEKIGYDWDNVGQFKNDHTTSKYGKYEIRNTILGIPFWKLGKVADIELKNNSDVCGVNCFAEKEITLYESGILVDDIIFKTLQEDGRWINQPIRNYRFSYVGEIKKYKTECVNIGETSNGSAIQSCNQVENGTSVGRINYNVGDVVPSGNYNLRLDGQKKPSRTVDWIIKTNGIWTDEWAIWGNISSGDDAEVILNSPEDNFVSLINEVQFNCSANVTGGALLENISLYTNESGVWEAKNTTLFIEDNNLISYYEMDEDSGVTVVDVNLINNATNINGVTIDQPGLINKSYSFSGSGQYLTIDTPSNYDDNSTGSISIWLKTSNTIQSSFILSPFKDASNRAGLFNGPSGMTWGLTVGGSFEGTSNVAWANDTWVQWVITHNGTHTKFYKDGILEEILLTNFWLDSFSTMTDFWIGSKRFDNTSFYDGFMDEIAIFGGRVLTDGGITVGQQSGGEIGTLYNSGAGRRPVNLGTETIITEIWNRIISETTLWSCEACDSDDDCGFATTNRTAFLDIEHPQITVENPVGILGYNFINGNETLNVTFTDSGLDYCWYNYNGTNVTIDGCLTGVKNSTIFILEEDNFNMTVYANDTLGNENSTFIEWDYVLLESNQSFTSSVVELSDQTFSINSTVFSGFNAQSATLVYNGTSFPLSTKALIGGITIFEINITILPGIQRFSSENRVFFWNITINNETSGEIINVLSTENNQTVSELNFGLCSASLNVSMLNFTMFNEVDGTEINATLNATTFQATFLIGSSVDTLLKNISINNISVGTNEFDFCTDNENNTIFIDMELFYTADGFSNKRYFISGGTLTNNTNEISLFLLPSALSIEFFVTVERNLFALPSAIVQIQKLIIGEGLFKTVDIQKTDNDGKFVSFLDLNKEYRFTVIKDSEVLIIDDKSSICESVPCELKIQIGTTEFNLLSGLENFAGDVLYNISYNAVTRIVTFDFVDVTGLATSFRMVISKLSFTSEDTIVSDQQLFTSSGTMTFNMTGETGDFTVKVFISRSPFSLIDLFSFTINDIAGELGLIGLLFAFLLILTIIFGVALKPSLLILSVPIALITTKYMGIISIGWTALTAILILAAISFFALER